jgi:predicted nucleic acid-binding protein
MSDKIFIDSNIHIYCYSSSDLQKQAIARKLALLRETYISTQVVSEIVNVFYKKFKAVKSETDLIINDLQNNFGIYTISVSDIKEACVIASKYKLSYYDSLIIAAALACKCSVLYSEDFHHGLKIESQLTIINPFR